MTALNRSALRVSHGLWGLWLVAALLAVGLTALAAFSVYPPGDITLARAVQSLRIPGLEFVSDGLYRLGAAPLFQIIALAVAAFLAWRGRRLTAAFLVFAVLARGMSGVLKELVERPRPSPFLVDVSEQAGGFSFPSGHVLGTVLLWGFVCYAAHELIPNRQWRRAVQLGCLALIVLMGLQRVYVGAHWPTDVLGAYLWGAVILSAIIATHRFFGRRPPLHI